MIDMGGLDPLWEVHIQGRSAWKCVRKQAKQAMKKKTNPVSSVPVASTEVLALASLNGDGQCNPYTKYLTLNPTPRTTKLLFTSVLLQQLRTTNLRQRASPWGLVLRKGTMLTNNMVNTRTQHLQARPHQTSQEKEERSFVLISLISETGE